MEEQIIRQLKNARGFTLVELLAVIVILGIIVAIAVPSIGSIIDDTRESATEAEEALVEDAARVAYAADDEIWRDSNGDYVSSVTVADLKSADYLDNSENLPDDGEVNYSNGEFNYSAP